MSLNIAEELEKMSKEHFINAEADISIKKKDGEVSIKIDGDTATILVLMEDALASMLVNCFGKDTDFINNTVVDTFAENVKELVKEKNNDRS